MEDFGLCKVSERHFVLGKCDVRFFCDLHDSPWKRRIIAEIFPPWYNIAEVSSRSDIYTSSFLELPTPHAFGNFISSQTPWKFKAKAYKCKNGTFVLEASLWVLYWLNFILQTRSRRYSCNRWKPAARCLCAPLRVSDIHIEPSRDAPCRLCTNTGIGSRWNVIEDTGSHECLL